MNYLNQHNNFSAFLQEKFCFCFGLFLFFVTKPFDFDGTNKVRCSKMNESLFLTV